MKPNDLKVATQLRIALGAILLLVLLLGAVSWRLGNSLWEQTRNIYEHPLTIRRALDEVRVDLFEMHRAMTDLIPADDEQEREALLLKIDAHEAQAARHLEVFFNRSYK